MQRIDIGLIVADMDFDNRKQTLTANSCEALCLYCFICIVGGVCEENNPIWNILNLLQGKYQPTAEAVAEIIEELVACELFSGDQFNSKTITSIRAQRTYYCSTVDRKAVNIDFDKWLLSESEMKALSKKWYHSAQFY